MEFNYTKINPTDTECGYLFLEYDELQFEIDWNQECKTIVSELIKYHEDTLIKSYDWDDYCDINFEEIIVDDVNELIILV